MKLRSFIVCAVLLCFELACAQPGEQRVKVIVAPDHADWTYKANDKVKFTITVLQDGNPIKNARIRYEIAPEKMEPVKKDSTTAATGITTVEGTLKSGGF